MVREHRHEKYLVYKKAKDIAVEIFRLLSYNCELNATFKWHDLRLNTKIRGTILHSRKMM